jgi:hypothetical protein
MTPNDPAPQERQTERDAWEILQLSRYLMYAPPAGILAELGTLLEAKANMERAVDRALTKAGHAA